MQSSLITLPVPAGSNSQARLLGPVAGMREIQPAEMMAHRLISAYWASWNAAGTAAVALRDPQPKSWLAGPTERPEQRWFPSLSEVFDRFLNGQSVPIFPSSKLASVQNAHQHN